MDAGPVATTLSNHICKTVQIITNLLIIQELGIATGKKKKKVLFFLNSRLKALPVINVLNYQSSLGKA